MRTRIETEQSTKTAYQGQAGTYLIQGELGRANTSRDGRKGPVLAMVGKLFKATSVTGQRVTVSFTVKP